MAGVAIGLTVSLCVSAQTDTPNDSARTLDNVTVLSQRERANVISSKQPLTINILTDDENHLVISNKIQPKIGKEDGTGIGLANLSERYRIKWNENVEIFDDGKIFSVTLPLKQIE